MAIIPPVVGKIELKKGFRGYVPEMVDELLDKLVLGYEKLHKENVLVKNQNVSLAKSNISLQDEIRELNNSLGNFRAMEHAIQNALISSEKMSVDIQRKAIEKAEIIEKEARKMAKEIIEIAEQKKRYILSQASKKKDQ